MLTMVGVQPIEDQTRTRFGKYSLTRRLAEGGMATLYLATADGPGGFSKPCVVKRIRAPFSSSQRFRDMLGQEARVAALLNHPNIAQVFDYGEIDGECYLTMEYVEGVALDQIFQLLQREQRRLALPTVIFIGLVIADALAHVHDGVQINGVRRNIVHRDVSPSNILVATSGVVKLTDFGIVKLLESSGATEAGVVKGKYGYMSPEQLMGRDIDGQTDVFALGTVLIELLTGQSLFKRRDVAATITAVLGAHVPHLHELYSDITSEVDEILRRAIARRKEDRYPSARAFHAELSGLAGILDMSHATADLAGLVRQLSSEATTLDPRGRVPSSISGGSSRPAVHSMTPTPSFGEVLPIPEDLEEEGYGLLIWVALITTVVVASVIVWILMLAR